MKCTFVCASSCIKYYEGCSGTPVGPGPYVCLYCTFFFVTHTISLQKSTGTKTKNIFLNEQKVGMLLQKRTDTRGVGISSMRKSIYLLTTTPTSHTHRFYPLPLATPTSCSPHPLAIPIHSSHTHTFHPLSTTVIHTFNLCKVQSMDDNCGEWVECMHVANGCGEQEVGVVSRRWVWLVGVGGIYGCGY